MVLVQASPDELQGFDDSDLTLAGNDREGITAENVRDRDQFRNAKRFGSEIQTSDYLSACMKKPAFWVWWPFNV